MGLGVCVELCEEGGKGWVAGLLVMGLLLYSVIFLGGEGEEGRARE